MKVLFVALLMALLPCAGILLVAFSQYGRDGFYPDGQIYYRRIVLCASVGLVALMVVGRVAVYLGVCC
jgi:hypothetical protein